MATVSTSQRVYSVGETISVSAEGEPPMTVSLLVDGEPVATKHIPPDTLPLETPATAGMVGAIVEADLVASDGADRKPVRVVSG